MAGKYEIKKAKNGQFHFNLKASNGQIILTSESYKAKSGATNGIKSVQKNSPDDARYERKKSSSGKDCFVLKAKNNQVIGSSEMYSSASAMENGIASVKKNGPTKTIDDLAWDSNRRYIKRKNCITLGRVKCGPAFLL